ncbi:PQQ-dependent sugar dehydrogenase [Demequina sp. NBRC 110054]|uniref:PQQ-dependent sugar dehydrogenase n=1 Tax=Demequina sp. NBRC 110054 TaxID=1570343 RepID=UPI00135640AF|nr:PQQ-dependent sugar dehydrogenase [Demequina sp. NBRC 110054]
MMNDGVARADVWNMQGSRRWGIRTLIAVLIALLIVPLVAISRPADAAVEGPLSLEGFSDEAVATTGLSEPTSMAFLPDGRMLVLQKGGEIKIGNPATVPMTMESYMTIVNIDNDQERGLLDIALDPDFENNGYFYLYYQTADPEHGRIARFTHVENTGGLTSRGDLASEFVVWQDTTGYTSCCHYGAGLDFGPDDNLWLTIGDQFDGERADDLTDPSGSVIRVEPDGDVPPDNPFADGAGGINPYIWAWGLRNPFRASWDIETNRFFIGEVGGNDIPESWEDIHIAKYDDEYKGLDYGWPGCEGPYPYTDYPDCTITDGSAAEPIFSYQHVQDGGTGNASLTGGFVYRGNQFPSEWQGVYFYGDYTRHFIRYLTFDDTGEVVTGDYDFKPSTEMPGSTTTVVSIVEGTDGALYYNNIYLGQIRRIVYEGGNQAPVISSATADVTDGPGPLTVNFDAAATDVEGDDLTYTWYFGDGETATGASVQHTYTVEGPYDAYVSVSDNGHTVVSDAMRIQVGVAPTVTITSPTDGDLFRAGDVITVEGIATDDGALSEDDYEWTVQFGHDNHFHPGDAIDNGTSGSFEVPTSGHDYSNETWYRVTLTVTDELGLVGTDTVEVYPDKVDVTFATEPEGLVLQLDSSSHTAPFVHDTLIDFEHEISAVTPQCLGEDQYVFTGWSDGGDATHTVTVPDSDTTLTATFELSGKCAAPVTDGLVMRLQGDQGVTASGTSVSGWADLSGSGNNLGVTSAAPTLVEEALSGHSVVSFDGVDDGLGRSSVLELPTESEDRSIFMFVKYDGANSSGGWAGFTYGAPYTNEVFGLVRTSDGDLGIQGWGNGNDFDSDADADGAGWLSQSVVLSGDEYSQYLNGTLTDSGTHTYDTGSDRIRLGAELGGTRRIDMDVAEILVYDRAVTDTEREQIETYFEQQYLGGETVAEPTVTLTEPSDGAVLETSDVTVSWESGGDLATGDHVHLTLDDGEHVTVMEQSGSYTFTGVEDGDHTVTVQVASMDHVTYSNAGASDSADFTVSTEPLSGDFPLGGLVLHVESDLNVISGTDGTVGGWLDQSGRGNDLDVPEGDPTQGEVTTPTGQNAISFDGDGDSLQRITSLNGMPSGNAARTVLTVVNYESNGWGGFSWGASYCGETFGTTVSADGDLAVQGWCTDADSNVDGNGAGWLVQSAVYGSGELTQYKDGVEISSSSRTYDTATDKIVLGAEIDGSPYVDMDVAAVLVFNRVLSSSELAQANTYLSQKYITGAVEDVAPSVPSGVAADAGDGQVDLSWSASTDLNGDLAGYHVFRAESSGVIDVASDDPVATVTSAGFVDDAVVNGTEYFYVVTAFDDLGNESAASAEVSGLPEVFVPDTTAPEAPTGLAATAGEGSVTLAWDEVTASDLAGYHVFRAESSGVIDVASDDPVATVTSAGFIDDTVVNGTEYFYVVTAFDDSDNESGASAEVSGLPEAVPSACTVPYGSEAVLCLVSGAGVQGASTVTGWLDQSDSGNDLDTVTGDPTVGTVTTPAGAAAISFDGDSDSLQRVGSLTAMPTGAADRTVFTVANYESNGWGGFSWGAPYCGYTFGTVVSGDGDLAVQGWCGDFDSNVDGNGAGWLVQSAVYGSGELTHYKDGVEIDSATHTFKTGSDKIMLGVEIDGSPSIDMDVAAVIVFDRALSASEHQAVVDYLESTYIG